MAAAVGVLSALASTRPRTAAASLDRALGPLLERIADCMARAAPDDERGALDAEEAQYARRGFVYDESVDIWALGVMGYELLFGELPFTAQWETELEQKIVRGEWAFPAEGAEGAVEEGTPPVRLLVAAQMCRRLELSVAACWGRRSRQRGRARRVVSSGAWRR